jgi:hypothetical protein
MAPSGSSAISFTLNTEGLDKKQAKQFQLKESGVVRIGRSPVADFVIDHRGISQYHAELRVLPDAAGPLKLCVRDLSSNGTGLKRPGAEGATCLTKNVDEPLADGVQLLVPMRLKETHLARAWLTVNLHGLVDVAKADVSGGGKAESSSKGKKARRAKSPSEAGVDEKSGAAKEDGSGSDQEADAEAARKKFVELLLQTREISGTTTYQQAEKLLSSDPAWSGCDAPTRKECFHIFVDHLGDTSSKKKDKKKKDKDKDKGKKKDKEKGGKEKGSPADAGKRSGKKKRRSASRGGCGSASRSPSRNVKRRRRHRSGSG